MPVGSAPPDAPPAPAFACSSSRSTSISPSVGVDLSRSRRAASLQTEVDPERHARGDLPSVEARGAEGGSLDGRPRRVVEVRTTALEDRREGDRAPAVDPGFDQHRRLVAEAAGSRRIVRSDRPSRPRRPVDVARPGPGRCARTACGAGGIAGAASSWERARAREVARPGSRCGLASLGGLRCGGLRRRLAAVVVASCSARFDRVGGAEDDRSGRRRRQSDVGWPLASRMPGTGIAVRRLRGGGTHDHRGPLVRPAPAATRDGPLAGDFFGPDRRARSGAQQLDPGAPARRARGRRRPR